MGTLVEHANATVAATRRNLSVCILDGDPDQVELLVRALERAGFPTSGTTSPEEALQTVKMGGCRVVLADCKLPAMDGFTFLEKTLQHDPGMHVLFVTGFYSVDSVIEAIKRGACDYLCKPVDLPRLFKALDDLAELFSQRSEIRHLEGQLLQNSHFRDIVGKGPAMMNVFDPVKKISRHYTNVLITGPTGAGKEPVAHALHQLSPVARERLAVCNCSALVDTLLESQLFGHVRGAFTGATDTQPGLFDYANGGTVFLDEVGEISLPLQSKLLRVIQNREIQRVGSPELRKVNVRIIAATNRNLRQEVLAGRFREDLFYRLGSIEIRVPGLNERPEDLPVLIQHFLKKYGQMYGKKLQGLSRRAQLVLRDYQWPGNVRELENVISTAAITATADFIDVGDLPEHLRKPQSNGLKARDWRPLPVDEVRRIHIQRVLETCHGNRVRAAHMLGIGRTSLYRFLKRAGNSQTAPAQVN
jgi:DNA-binding NtrC family response regulator